MPSSRFVLGDFSLTRCSDGTIFIVHDETGEGAQFQEAEVAAVIEQFYRDSF